jgi:HlyD family secretion protein
MRNFGERNMKKRVLPVILVIIFGILISACGGNDAAAEAQSALEPDYLIAEGSLQPVKALDLSYSVSGQVQDVLVKDGDKVEVDQVLAKLEDVPDLEETLARARQEVVDAQNALDDYNALAEVNIPEAEIEVILARSRYKNARDNYLDGRSSEREARMDEAEAEMHLAEQALEDLVANYGLDPDQVRALEARLDAAQAAVDSANADIDALLLRASMAGTVVDVDLTIGQQVNAGEVVMSLADYSSWVVKTDSLTEIEVIDVSLDQQVEVVLDALPDIELKGVVTNINERFEEKRGDITYTVTVELQETDPRMRWGMTAAVYFMPPAE